jgi:uncharacterized protein (TIGR02231 family)
MPPIHNQKSTMTHLPLCLTLAICLLPALPASAAQIQANHRIAEVTVYPDRAVVTRRGSASLPVGEHQLVFENLPIGLDENSVRAGGTGSGWKILGVELKRDYREPSQSPEVLKLRDLIQASVDKKQDLNDEQNDLNQKRDLLSKLSREASSGSADDENKKPTINVADIQKLVEYYGSEINKISLRLRAIERVHRLLDKELERLHAELAKLEKPGNPQNRKVAVTVQADVPTTAQVEISYMIGGASWSPQYDVHAGDDTQKIVLTAYGVIRQRTGENWEDIKVVLSTARPQLGTSVPDLDPWILDLVQPPSAPSIRATSPQGFKSELRRNFAGNEAAGVSADDASVQTLAATVEQRGFSAVYKVPGNTTVPSDGEPHRTTISRQEMTAKAEFTATPKLMPGAFVKAKVQNANAAPLLPGPLNVFMGNDFIGSSQLSLVGPEGAFDVFLGKDDGIKVQRKDKVRKEETSGLLQKSRLIKTGYTIEVENMKRTEVAITVKDQIPVSSISQIRVRTTGVDPKPSKDTKETGELAWEIKLKPKEKKTITVDLEIEAPLDTPLIGI